MGDLSIMERIKAAPDILGIYRDSKMCQSLFELAYSSIPKYPVRRKLSEYCCDLVVPNENIRDIDQVIKGRVKDTEGPESAEPAEKIDRLSYVKTRLQKFTAYLLKNRKAEDAEGADPDLLTANEKTILDALLRFSLLAYCTAKMPDLAPFPMFLFYVGSKEAGRNGDIHDIDNYVQVALEPLRLFHNSINYTEHLNTEISAIEIQQEQICSSTDVVDFTFPRYDPRHAVNCFRRTAAGKRLGKAVNDQRKKNEEVEKEEEEDGEEETDKKVEKADSASSSDSSSNSSSNSSSSSSSDSDSDSDSDSSAKKKKKKKKNKKEKKEKKDKKSKKQEKEEKKDDKKKNEKKKPKEEKKEEKKEDIKEDKKEEEKKTKKKDTKKAPKKDLREAMEIIRMVTPAEVGAAFAAQAAAVAPPEPVVAVITPIAPPPALAKIKSNDPLINSQERPFVVSDEQDLIALGVPPLSRNDVTTNCVWTAHEGMTGHTVAPSVSEIHSLCRVMNQMKKGELAAASYPSDLMVRYIMTLIGKNNPSVIAQPVIDSSTKAVVELPPLGSMDVSRIGSILTPQFVAPMVHANMLREIAEEAAIIIVDAMAPPAATVGV